jgi:hypothetical protein
MNPLDDGPHQTKPERWSVLMPDNDFGIAPGYYTQSGVVALLRACKGDTAAVQFIADMME